MKCPFCSHPESKVVDSRLGKEKDTIRRRRECLGCHKRFTTSERAEDALPLVVKKDGRRFLKRLCLNRYGILIRRFAKKVDLEGMSLMGPVHLKRDTVHNPFNVFSIVHVMMDIDIAVTDFIRLLCCWLVRRRKLFRLLGRREMIEQMPKMRK
jgi:hypothetical protein